MSLRFCTLGSGSGGNAAVVCTPRTSLLIDSGLSLRVLGERIKARGMALDDIDALIVTHTHGDHVRGSAITACVNHRILMYNHAANEEIVAHKYAHFRRLAERRLNVTFGDAPLVINDLTIRPVAVPHDADGVTVALLIEHDDGEDRQRIAFATDLGGVPRALTDHFAECDVLVLEFNHDAQMLQNSRRTQFLKDRVNGTHGHLSNAQAAAALRTILARGSRPPLAVVAAHLSGECNTPCIVSQILCDILQKHKAPKTRVILAAQDKPSDWLDIASLRGQLSLF